MSELWGEKIPGGYFDEVKHLYRNERGIIVPSVTQIFTILGMSDFSMISPEVLEWKRQYGTAVHRAIELLVNNDLDWDTLDDAIIAPVAGLEQKLKELEFKGTATEEKKVVAMYGMEYGCTLDLKGEITHKGKRQNAIIDIKTGAREDVSWKWQLAAYALAQEVKTGWMGVVIKVDKDGDIKPFYYDLLPAGREFQILLSAAILKINNGLAKVGG